MSNLVGRTLGKYQLVERLGRGGMAEVYKAYQPSLERHVAVKVLHSHLAEDEDFIARFHREAKAVAGLHHPDIVQVFDFDIQDDLYFMAMEFIEGPTLKAVLSDLSSRGTVLGLRSSIEVAAHLADALDYAQAEGMVHRDVKPANVLMRRQDQPVLSDFGIARILGSTGLTASGAMVGTPAYMSPEQGRGEKADARSDIYALGVVFYEMLAGSPPYDADTPYAVILKHINDPIPMPREKVEGLPEPVESVVLKALAKEPEDRFATAGAMRDALRQLNLSIDDTPLSVRTPPAGVAIPPQPVSAARTEATVPLPPQGEKTTVFPDTTQKKSRLWLWLLAAAAAFGLLAAVAVGGAVALGLFDEDDPTPKPTLVSDVSPTDAVVVQDDVSDSSDNVVPNEQVAPGEQQNEVASNLAHEGFEQFNEGSHDAALEFFEQALNIDPNNVEALVGRALIEMDYENAEDSAADLDRAVAIAPNDPLVQFGLGSLYNQTDQFWDPDLALDAFTQAIDGCGDITWLCARSYKERANVLAWNFEDVDGALFDIDRAIDLEPDPFELPFIYVTRADILLELADSPLGALEDYEQGYMLSDGFGDWILEEAARVALQIDDIDRALGYEQTLLEESNGDPRFLVGRSYLEWQADRPEDAFASAQRALELDHSLLGARYVQGLIHLDAGRPQQALDQFFPVSEEPDMYVYSEPFLNTEFGHSIYYDMARAALALGDPDQALAWIDEALFEDDYWPQPHILRGEILEDNGFLGEARESYQMAVDVAFGFGDEELALQLEERLLALSQ